MEYLLSGASVKLLTASLEFFFLVSATANARKKIQA